MELNFQRGKSFEELSHAITETTITANEDGATISTSSTGTAHRSNLHKAESHPALGTDERVKTVRAEPLSNNDPELLAYLRAHAESLNDEQRATLDELERREAVETEAAPEQ